MANEYKIKLSVRGETSEFGADNVSELLLLMATELFRMDLSTLPQNKGDVEVAAKKLVEKYHQRFIKNDNRNHSPMADAGLEVDVAKCYLQGMTIKQTVFWLKKEKDFKASKTAIGRYWVKFAQANSEE